MILPPEVGESVAAMFTGTSVRLVQYPGAGHMPMLEQPEATGRDAIAFLEARE